MADERGDVLRIAPAGDDAYRAFIPASLGLAVFLGFALGIHVAVSRLTGGGSPERNADLLHAHGQVQLLGFAGLYVMGMSLRLLPRFSGARIVYGSLLPLTLGFMVAGLIGRAIVLPLISGDLHDVVLVIIAAAVLAASACFFVVIAGSARSSQDRDPSLVAFVCGATFLLVSALVTLLEAIDVAAGDQRTIPLLGNNAILQLQLGGFLMSFIAGVSFRAIPTMAGVPRPGKKAAYATIAGLSIAVVVLGASLLYLEHGEYSSFIAFVVAAAFALFGVALLVLSWQAGVLRRSGSRLRPASQSHIWLVRSAFAWMAFAGLFAIYAGVNAAVDRTLPAQFEFDAVRHALGVGFVTSLIAGMSLMILPEFAVQRQHADQRPLAFTLFALLNLATLLRVAPSIAGTAWSFDQRNLSMAVAGSLAEVALIIFAVSLLRLLGGARALPSR